MVKIMKKSTFLIAGKHAVIAALKNTDRKVLKIFLTEDSKKIIHKESPNNNLLKNITIFYKNKKELDRLCSKDQISHQGMIAEVEHIEEKKIKDYLNENQDENIIFAAIEDVTDPRNIGSIIRSAVAFNIDGIIVKERSYPSKSKLLYKSASGATEHIKIFKVSNINTSLKFLKTKGFWVSAFDTMATKDFTTNNWKGKNILLFGSEGKGLKKNTKEKADFYYKINIKNIESLNVSNSVSIVCHFINEKIS